MVDRVDLERKLAEAARRWDEDLRGALVDAEGEAGGLALYKRWVGAFPATQAGMRQVLGSDELARSLSANGPPVEARVELRRNATTASGYVQASSRLTLSVVRVRQVTAYSGAGGLPKDESVRPI